MQKWTHSGGILFADPVLANRRAGVFSGAYRAFRQRLTKHEPLSRLFYKHCFNDGVGGVSEDKHGSASTMCPQEAHGKGHRYRCLTLHERLRDREACSVTVGNRCCFSLRKQYQAFQWFGVILQFNHFSCCIGLKSTRTAFITGVEVAAMSQQGVCK